MYRCSRCGQYCVPGYLECACRTTSRQHDPHTGQGAVHAQDSAGASPSRNTKEPSQLNDLSDKHPAQGHKV
jgi:hypothetical protein